MAEDDKPPVVLVLGVMLCAVILSGCAGETERGEGRDHDGLSGNETVSERTGGEYEGDRSSGREGGDSGGERVERREGAESREGGEHNSGSDGADRESGEAEMSSPVVPLGQSWNGVLGGLAVSMQYDATSRAVHGIVENTLSQKLCYVQAEPHLKSGARTVGELGPDRLGDLSPGQEARSRLLVSGEPKLAGVSYDGYVVHMEVYGCGGPGPVSLAGEGNEQGEEHASIGEGGRESSESGGEEEDRANSLALDETFDMVRSGARLVLNYDSANNSFEGTVKNTTDGVLNRVRIEVHLSNGTELGPTTPTEMAPGEVVGIDLPATPASFTSWIAHAEVGGGEKSESGGEHAGDGESRGGGEHGGVRESGGEHGRGDERH